MSVFDVFLQDPLWPYVVLIVFGVLPSEVWRILGVVLSRGLSEQSPLIEWVRLVATSLLCAVVVKLLLLARRRAGRRTAGGAPRRSRRRRDRLPRHPPEPAGRRRRGRGGARRRDLVGGRAQDRASSRHADTGWRKTMMLNEENLERNPARHCQVGFRSSAAARIFAACAFRTSGFSSRRCEVAVRRRSSAAWTGRGCGTPPVRPRSR